MLLQNSRNLFLVGPTATGKTTLGRLLADELGLRFEDSDHAIALRAGADIEWIFDVEGEDGFRRRERKVIDELTAGKDLLLATGAGAVLHEANRRHLAGRGFVVFLDTSIDIQLQRAGKGRKRPLLSGDAREVLARMRDERHHLYEEVADLRHFVDISSPKKVLHEMLEQLADKGYPARPGSAGREPC